MGSSAEANVAPHHGLRRGLAVASATVATAVLLSYFSPPEWANTAVGFTFLAATWLTVLRHDSAWIRLHGLSFGGIAEPVALDLPRLARQAMGALAWALGLAVLFFPPFYWGFRAWWRVDDFRWFMPPHMFDLVLGQLLVVALPEEAFFRGYLQPTLESRFASRRWKIAGARLGVGTVLASAIFAVGHLLTIPVAARLAVFFPSLLFGWLRARTGGVGASILFHALCNVYSAWLVQCAGLAGPG
jgi:uncharacterized protein